MPTQKDLKRLVRRRMQKTGESYTAARAQLLNKRSSNAKPSNGARPSKASLSKATATRDYAKLAGMSDATIEARTGCTWKSWADALDYVNAHTWPHGKIAKYVHEKFSVPGWWAQAVTVGYERIRGLREIGQRRGGGYEANKSRTFAVPVSVLYKAFAVARARERWLPGVKLTVRKATPDKSVRITWPDATSVEIFLVAKGPEKGSVSVQHRKLPDKESATRMKSYWAERLDVLARVLTN